MTGQIQPFAFEGLPNLPAIAAGRSRAAARAVASSSRLRNVSARGIGKVVLGVERIDPAPWRGEAAGAPPESAFSLVRDDNTWACLTIERFFALALVRAALGAPSPPVLRPLSPAERGVLGAMVATVLHASASGRVRLSLERPRRPERDFVGINLSIRTASLNGVGLLELPVGWLPSVATSLPDEAAFLLETELRIELGRVALPAAAWATAEVGDAVVFEGVSSPKDDSPWSCELAIGAHRAPAQLSTGGDLRLDKAFAPGGQPWEAEVSASDKGGGEPAPGQAGLLASAPVEVVAEIGRVPMRGDEVMGLASGTVVALGERRRDLVTLRVGGRPWARGELVNVDDQLGVRITELLRPR
jgi:flagellar motor switch protein FliN